MKGEFEIYTDGACSGNPGQAGIGAVILKNGKVVKEISKPIGNATNNIAEYAALVYALQEAVILKAKKLTCYTDSELMYRQLRGEYKVKDEKIKFLHDQARLLTQAFDQVDFHHVRREKNKKADKLAVSSLKKKQTKMVAPLFDDIGEESPSSEG